MTLDQEVKLRGDVVTTLAALAQKAVVENDARLAEVLYATFGNVRELWVASCDKLMAESLKGKT